MKTFLTALLIFLAAPAYAADFELPFPPGGGPPVRTAIPIPVELGGTFTDASDWVNGECLQSTADAHPDGTVTKRVITGPCGGSGFDPTTINNQTWGDG